MLVKVSVEQKGWNMAERKRKGGDGGRHTGFLLTHLGLESTVGLDEIRLSSQNTSSLQKRKLDGA